MNFLQREYVNWEGLYSTHVDSDVSLSTFLAYKTTSGLGYFLFNPVWVQAFSMHMVCS